MDKASFSFHCRAVYTPYWFSVAGKDNRDMASLISFGYVHEYLTAHFAQLICILKSRQGWLVKDITSYEVFRLIS